MFKDALKTVTSTIVSATKDTLNSYKPTAENAKGSFERIAHQGIANLSYRSPVLADIAETMLRNFQVEMAKREEIKNFVASDKSNNLREKVSEKLKTGDVDKINAEMFSILTKLSKSIDMQGTEQTKKTALFKEYENYFEEFKKANPPKAPESQPGQPGPGGVLPSPQLDKIEANTARTVNVLEELSTQRAVGGNSGASGTSDGNKTSASYIDPVTGMPSIRAAIGSIGGSILAKVFDDDFTDKIAAKIKRNKASVPPPAQEEVEEPAPTPAPVPKKSKKLVIGAQDKSISEVLGDLSLDLNMPPKEEDKRENNTKLDIRAAKVMTVEENQLSELKKLTSMNPGAGSPEKKSMLDSVTDGLKDKVMSKGGSALSTISRMAPMAGTAALWAGGAAAAGAAGYGIGKHIINPLIDGGLSKLTGSETTLGSSLYDLFNEDPNAKYNEELKKKLAAKKKSPSVNVNQLNSAKAAAAVPKAQGAVVAINQQAPEKAHSSPPTIIVPASVRNTDSTFERVQMQDFWPRVA